MARFRTKEKRVKIKAWGSYMREVLAPAKDPEKEHPGRWRKPRRRWRKPRRRWGPETSKESECLGRG